MLASTQVGVGAQGAQGLAASSAFTKARSPTATSIRCWQLMATHSPVLQHQVAVLTALLLVV